MKVRQSANDEAPVLFPVLFAEGEDSCCRLFRRSKKVNIDARPLQWMRRPRAREGRKIKRSNERSDLLKKREGAILLHCDFS